MEYSDQFKKDVKKAHKRHKNMNTLKTIMELLINDKLSFPVIYKDHQLQGNYKDYRDAHTRLNQHVNIAILPLHFW
ncbi:TPA: type II toxin-antitoxin system YafQ family toxin [Yersinia enterocolitica]|nr:type II toxin-antitoxin system YafQ family toxin [Yersinia enterocolitica]